MKRFIRASGIAAAILCLLLAGCGTPMAKLTPEEENLIVAYAAGSVAKANKYMTKGLTYPKEEEEEKLEVTETYEDETAEVPEEYPDQNQTVNGDGSMPAEEVPPPVQPATLTEALNQEFVQAEYRGYELCTSYKEGNYFALNAETGKTYLVLHIGLLNTSQQPVECNLFARNLMCSIYINDVYAADAIATVLTNDFTTYIGTLEAAAETDTVAIFEVPAETVQTIQLLSLDMEVDGTVYHVTLDQN